MHLIVGLGNPGKSYESTRHNLGFMAIDYIADRYGFTNFQKKFDGLTSSGLIQDHKVILLKPSTYMNLSGGSVAKAMQFYKIALDHVVVLHDELDLDVGRIKTKIGGGSAGHNGIKHIDQSVGKNYTRVRVGIGRPPARMEASDYVLQTFSKHDMEYVEPSIQNLTDAFTHLLDNDLDGFNQACL